MKFENRIKAIGVMTALLLSIVVTSCIEEGEDKISGKGTNEFRFETGEFSVVTFKPFLADQTSTLVNIYRDAVSTGSMGQAIDVKFTISADSLDEYNTENETDFLLVDPTWYSLALFDGSSTPLEDGDIITFAPNESVKTIKVTIDTNPFDLTLKYALPIVLTDATSGYTLNEGHNFTVIQTLPINKYDGLYTVTEGTMVDAANGTLSHINNYWVTQGEDKQIYALVTAGESKCDVYDYNFFGGYYSPIASTTDGVVGYSRYGSFCPSFEFNGDDVISVVTNYNGQPAGNSRYASANPDSKNQWTPDGIEDVGYFMHQPTVVVDPPYIRTTWTETWEYLEPR